MRQAALLLSRPCDCLGGLFEDPEIPPGERIEEALAEVWAAAIERDRGPHLFQASDVVPRFDRALARMAKRNAGFSDAEVAADVAAARDELPG